MSMNFAEVEKGLLVSSVALSFQISSFVDNSSADTYGAKICSQSLQHSLESCYVMLTCGQILSLSQGGTLLPEAYFILVFYGLTARMVRVTKLSMRLLAWPNLCLDHALFSSHH